MSADPKIVVERLRDHLEGLGLTVYLWPMTVDPSNVGLRMAFASFSRQGDDRERIGLEATLSGRGLDPGLYLSAIIRHSRILSGLLERGFEYQVSPSFVAKAEIKLISEGRFQQTEAEEKFDWEFQALYRAEISYNPAILDDPELAV